jgi:hypothetical protein
MFSKKMKKNSALLVVTVVMTLALISGTALSQSSLAERGKFGLGGMVGMNVPSPDLFAGINAKYFLDATNAFDFAIAPRITGNRDYLIWADYLYHFRSLITVEQGELPVYFGVGGRAKIQENNNDNKFGIRFPVGLAYEFAAAPVDIFLEFAPVWDVTWPPNYDFDGEGFFGVRFYF